MHLRFRAGGLGAISLKIAHIMILKWRFLDLKLPNAGRAATNGRSFKSTRLLAAPWAAKRASVLRRASGNGLLLASISSVWT